MFFSVAANEVVCVQYVEYVKGDESGFLRFDKLEDAQKVLAAATAEPEGGLTIAKHLVMFAVLEGTPSTLEFALFSVCLLIIESDFNHL